MQMHVQLYIYSRLVKVINLGRDKFDLYLAELCTRHEFLN
jgi:hypothetical protein